MSGAEVVVIGGGPAGLSAAIELRRRGVRVTVLEREQTAGGAPRHTAHVGFGARDLHRITTGPRYAAHLVHEAQKCGVDLRLGVTVTDLDGLTVRTATRTGPESITAGAVVLATGVRERPRAARLVPGDRPAGVFTTGMLQQFVALHHQRVGTRAVVVGAEHVSFSAVMTLRHVGCEVVALTTPLPRHQTYAPLEWSTTRRRRIPVLTGVDVAEVIGRTRVERVLLSDGRSVDCDTVVFTGDWIPEHELARRAGLPMLPAALAPVIDASMHTARRGVFAIGNLAHPAETADVCALDGRHVAPTVVDWLSLGRWPDRVAPITVAAPIAWASYDSRGITLRMAEPVDGRIRLMHSSEVQWISDDDTWLPNRSITIRTDAMKNTPRPYADHRLQLDVLR
ncbi:MAG: hypothetical protein RJA49_828 [Actinomycetota bacterium]